MRKHQVVQDQDRELGWEIPLQLNMGVRLHPGTSHEYGHALLPIRPSSPFLQESQPCHSATGPVAPPKLVEL